METFKVIEGCETYSVSDFGNMKNNTTGYILKNSIESAGYGLVVLMHNKKKHYFKTHRLVATSFIENPEGKLCIDHINNDKMDNNVNNLRWTTHTENCQNRKINKNNTSSVKGVSYDKKTNKWQAYIYIDGLKIYLGKFTNLEDAKQARMIRANQAFGIYTNACEKII